MSLYDQNEWKKKTFNRTLLNLRGFVWVKVLRVQSKVVTYQAYYVLAYVYWGMISLICYIVSNSWHSKMLNNK
jgi:hypothetical protein